MVKHDMRFKSVNWIYSILICQASLRQLAEYEMNKTPTGQIVWGQLPVLNGQ